MEISRVIAIGGSAGGLHALQIIFSSLTSQTLPPILIALHLAKDSQINPGLIFAPFTHRRILEAEDKMPLENDRIYFAPPNYHLLVEAGGFVALSVDEPVHYSRPSIDVLFDSAASAFGPGAVGVLLTGANADGAQGLRNIQKKGGQTYVQSPETAEAQAMPAAALRLFTPNLVTGLEEIGNSLARFAIPQGEA